MRVVIHLKETSQPIEHSQAITAYTKGPFFCVQVSEKVYKYPVSNIWRVTEDYGVHT